MADLTTTLSLTRAKMQALITKASMKHLNPTSSLQSRITHFSSMLGLMTIRPKALQISSSISDDGFRDSSWLRREAKALVDDHLVRFRA